MRLASANAVLLVLTGCIFHAEAQTPLAALAACGDDNVSFDVSRGEITDRIDSPKAGNANIYIIELLSLGDTGRVGRPVLRQGLDGQWIGATQGFTYLSASVAPGKHHLCSRWQSRLGELTQQVSLYDFKARAGESYYFRAQVTLMGSNNIPSLDLQPVSEDEGRFLLSQAARSLSKPKR